MDAIEIEDLEVFFKVGVTEVERARPQRLLLSLGMRADFRQAAATDDLRHTIDYSAVARRLAALGEGRSWNLIETLAAEVAGLVLSEFHAAGVTVRIKKFIVPHSRWVAVSLSRP